MSARHFRRHWGAEPAEAGYWRFAIWSPDVRDPSVVVEGSRTPMTSDGDCWLHATAPARPGQHYSFLLDGKAYPDPAARAQAGDVHGPSVIIDPRSFDWFDQWQGVLWAEAVIYELHIGTYTEEGTLDAARRDLARLKALGVTLIELMPVAQFDGRRGWGYDGVLPYTPHNAYGTPDDLKHFIDAAHRMGLGVILDVVYNHFGPSGNYLAAWCPAFFHSSRGSTWGQGMAYESPAVRTYFIENALYWLEEYQLDGLRLDAVHAMGDESPIHILDEIGSAVRAREWSRPIHLVTEDERNLSGYFADEAPFDATWNDDWHHAIHCLLTGEDESYYASFAVDPLADIEIALRDGYVEQGQARPPNAEPRGEPSGSLPRTSFINFLGNHDQIGNRAQGERLHQLARNENAIRVVTALTCLTPFVPMIFMGDEFLTDAPFLFFTDFAGELAEAVKTGRAKEFERFSAFAGGVPDPNAPETALRSRIGRAASQAQLRHEAFVRNLLDLRASHFTPLLRRDPYPSVKVERNGARLRAEWNFGGSLLRICCSLGDGPIEAPLDAFFEESPAHGRFAFAAATSKAFA